MQAKNTRRKIIDMEKTEELMSGEQKTPPEPDRMSVALTLDDWKNVLVSMEAGVSALGYSAFEIGGRVMREIKEQLEGNLHP